MARQLRLPCAANTLPFRNLAKFFEYCVPLCVNSPRYQANGARMHSLI